MFLECSLIAEGEITLFTLVEPQMVGISIVLDTVPINGIIFLLSSQVIFVARLLLVLDQFELSLKDHLTSVILLI